VIPVLYHSFREPNREASDCDKSDIDVHGSKSLMTLTIHVRVGQGTFVEHGQPMGDAQRIEGGTAGPDALAEAGTRGLGLLTE